MTNPRPDVLLVIDSFELGGTESFATRALEALRDDGIRVQVACLRPRGPLLERARAACDELHELPASTGPLRAPMLALALRQLIGKIRPRAVYAQDVYSNYLSAIAAFGVRDVRLVTSRRWARTSSRPRRVLAEWAAVRSDSVVVNSPLLATTVASEGVAADRILIVPNIIEDAMFARATASERLQWRALHAVPERTLILMVAGRLHPDKGTDLALEAFSRLPEGVRQSALLVLMGDGVLRSALEQRVRELSLESRVRLTGAYRTPPNVFGQADLALLPSRTEGMPNALLEAGAVGCASIACDVGGVRTLAQQLGESVRVIPPLDVEAMTRALSQAIADEQWRLTSGETARERIRLQNSTKAVVTMLKTSLFRPD